MKNGLSLCMIIKNEESSIERALSSFVGIANEIIIGDTGSTDNSINLSKKFGAKVIHINWKNSFAHARNQVLSSANYKWIFSLDADEYLSKNHKSILLKEIVNENICGYYIPFNDIQEDGAIKTFSLPRLFLNRPDIKFKNSIHESVLNDLELVSKNSNLNIIISKSLLFHTGYSKSVINSKEKLFRNLHMLENEYRKNRRNIFILLKYGENLQLVGRYSEALTVFNEAIQYIESENVNSPLINDIFFAASTLHIREGNLDIAEELCTKGNGYIQSVSISYNLALIAWKRGNINKAISLFQKVDKLIQKGLEDPSGAYPETLNALGILCLQNKSYQLAKKYLEQAVLSAPKNLSPLITLSRLEIETGDLDKARLYINKALSIDPANDTVIKINKLLKTHKQ